MTTTSLAFNAAQNPYTRQDLFDAIGKKDSACLRAIIRTSSQISLDEEPGDSKSPLLHAISSDNLEAVEILLEAGAKAETPPKEHGHQTPLTYALDKYWEYKCAPRAVILLLEHGANPDTPGDEDAYYLPLHMAAKSGRESVVEAMLDHGADVNKRDKYQHTAMHLAAEEGHAGVVRMLAERGADMSATDWLDQTPLYTAVQHGRRNVFELMVELGASPEKLDRGQVTLLMTAACCGETGIMDDMVKRGFDIDYQSETGATALIGAAGAGRSEAVRKLLQWGADPSIALFKDGKTARQIAAERGHTHIVKLLDEHVSSGIRKGLDDALKVRRPIALRRGGGHG